MNAPTVSVIIPCYEQAHFVGEAIESVLAQTYGHAEIIVVDDGSPDDTFHVATRFPGVRCLRQENQGLSAARNAGLRASTGDFVVFLDADDRLVPGALAVGVASLAARADCAFVYGHTRDITADGSPLPTLPTACVEENHYLALLKTNYIYMPAMVMYRRAALESAGGFDPSVNASADYDIYLRITRTAPVFCHNTVVAEYRQHGSSMSRNAALMLKVTLSVLRAQWPYVRGAAELERAYKEGIRNWQDYYGERLVNEARYAARSRNWGRVLDAGRVLLRYSRRTWAKHAFRKLYCIAFRVKSQAKDDLFCSTR
jgi:glycosyltransferase involved in cell wall biosynthesis